MKYECYFDGACTPMNPGGHMGIGAIIVDESGKQSTHTKYIKADKTNSNNVAEYMAFLWIIEKLTKIMNQQDVAVIYGDSKLVVNQMNNLWEIKGGKYLETAMQAQSILNKLRLLVGISIKWIPRERNKHADELANEQLIAHGIQPFYKKGD